MKTPSFSRAKRVNSPLHEHVKARIIGLSSSGCEHSPDDVTSLSILLHDFLHQNDTVTEHVSDTNHHPTDEIKLVQKNPTVISQEGVDDDVIRSKLLLDVSNAVEILSFSCLNPNQASLRRNVMAVLRDLGYNAGICKTKWQSCGGVTAGSYEFIDVVISESGESKTDRYFIDLDFAGEFEIAKRSEEYERQLRSLPSIFVGKNEELKKIVKFMTDAVKRSLKGNGLHLPPWRCNRYMMNKWLGPYKRTTALIPRNSLTASPTTSSVKCRLSGFDAVKVGSFIPAATRTR